MNGPKNGPKASDSSALLMVDEDWNPIPLQYIRPVAEVREAQKADGAVFRAFMGAVYQARKRTDFLITRDDALSLWERCAGKCEVSGILFSLDRSEQRFARRPWAPSIDQVQAGKGYGLENVRVVCIAVNYAMNHWGEEVLFRIAREIVANGKASLFPTESPATPIGE